MNDKLEIAIAMAGLALMASAAVFTHPWPGTFGLALYWALASLGLLVYAGASLAVVFGIFMVPRPNHPTLGPMNGFGASNAANMSEHRFSSWLKVSRIMMTVALLVLYGAGSWNSSYPIFLLGFALACDLAGAIKAELWWREFRHVGSIDPNRY